MRFYLFLVLPAVLSAQLIPFGNPIPKTQNPPVVFLNGYQLSCPSGGFSDTFGNADQLLAASQIASVFFDNCTVANPAPGKPTIEALGAAFANFLAALRYTDGTPVTQVDVIVHSQRDCAGRVPGLPALDQINCPIPAGVAGIVVPVIVTSNGRTANTVTLNIQ